MDNLEAFEALQDSNSRSSCSALVKRIRQLLDIVRSWRLDHIPRDGNKEVDQMAKMAFRREEELQLFVENPFVLVYSRYKTLIENQLIH
ncbi:hypothetical protein PVK06_035712 [Gossypium arboreum]|uniref:RNase H type-1 domain-containing protein n=1 Tax=Gossypium arboreum TaxID=29729 RepID=A0ABR0NHJ0_GOSAR|nr:hypothetical protein PVK06_035712 [Gossypium arboreum]